MYKKCSSILLIGICIFVIVNMTGCAKAANYDKNIMLSGQDMQWLQEQTDNTSKEAKEKYKLAKRSKIISVTQTGKLIPKHFSINAEIRTDAEYKDVLEAVSELSGEYPNVEISLELDLTNSSTKLYLDEIVASGNITYLCIENGGVVTTKASPTFHDNSLTHLRFYYIQNIEGDVLDGLEAVEDLSITIDSSFNENADLSELFDHSNCSDIMVYLEEDDKSTDLLYELLESRGLEEISEKENRYLDAVYLVRKDGYCYTSYILKNQSRDRHPHVFIYIEGESADTDGYFDTLEIPVNSEKEIYVRNLEWYKVTIYDVNFDGYNDINFAGEGSMPTRNYYRFLWNPTSEKYELCETAPSYECIIDMERKRLTLMFSIATSDDRYIYTYENGKFLERLLQSEYYDSSVRWDYHEDGELKESLFMGDDGDYIYTDSNGERIEGVFSGDDARDLQEQFFPDFDFRNAG